MSNRNILLAAAGVLTGNPNAWDISKAYYDAGADAGDISTAVYSGNQYQSVEAASPTSIAFSADGTKMYIVSDSTDTVYQYTLTNPFRVALSGATYDSKSFSFSSQDSAPRGLAFKSDGTKMYVIGYTNDTVYQYSLSSAWDVSTASYDSVSFSVASQESVPQGLTFKPDGTKMYIVGSTGDDVNEYNLSTAWDVSSASYVQNFSVATQELVPTGISFLGDGTKMYVVGTDSDGLYQYDLSTPWDISTASYVQTLSLTARTQAPVDIFIKPDGSMFFIMSSVDSGGNTDSTVIQYVIGGFSVAAQEAGTATGVFFKPDGTKMYVLGNGNDKVHEFSLSTAWDILSASFVDDFSVLSQDEQMTDIFFKPDGTKFYLTGQINDKVYEYSLSVAWDISTSSFTQDFSVSAQELGPTGLFFKDDGTKMYVTGSSGDDVNEYDLSTAWDISSSSFLQNFSVSAQQTFPLSLSFKPDGTKMYILGNTNDDIDQYDLSTGWDVSTASYVQTFRTVGTVPQGLFFRENGEQFFVVDSNLSKVFSYLISEE